ncbi:hypothetical protein BVRB_2g034140 [Beta vulgaris subsp. vulgaris]|nr:hypothetical protein BVRB_2g034140 [Beta vulgaris subsp. vulgaris]
MVVSLHKPLLLHVTCCLFESQESWILVVLGCRLLDV